MFIQNAMLKVKSYMMMSSNGNIFHITGHLCGEFTGPGEFPAQRPVTQSFDVFLDLLLNKRLSKQSWGWWFETLSCPLWRHCNGSLLMLYGSSVVTIKSGDGLVSSLNQCTDVSSIGLLGTNCWEIYEFLFEKMNLKMLSAKQQPFYSVFNVLTHLPWTKWPPFWQTTFSNAFSWMKMVEFRFKFHWNLIPGVQLTISKYWFS